MVERTFPTFELESTSNNATPTQTVKSKSYKRKSTGFTHKKVRKVHHDLPKPQTVQPTEKVTRKESVSSSSNKRRSTNQKEVGGSGEVGLVKPRVQIEIPSWRRVEDRLAAPTDWRRMEGNVEDSRDQVQTCTLGLKIINLYFVDNLSLIFENSFPRFNHTYCPFPTLIKGEYGYKE